MFGNIRTGRCVQSAPQFRHIPDRTLSHRPTSLDMSVHELVGALQPYAFSRTVGRGVEETDEGSGGAGDRLFEGAENGMLGGRGEEEDHVEGH